MIYLIRHAQAGPRGNYDELSVLGEQQAHLLGEHLAQQQINFDVMLTGNLRRQQQTAMLIKEHLARTPELTVDERWNEFKLGAVYQSIANQLCDEDEQFAHDFANMKSMLEQNAYAVSGAIARCDRAVMIAWLTERFPPINYEAWPDFQARVHEALAALTSYDSHLRIGVFTSATPIAIAVGQALHLAGARILELAWVMYNAGITTLKRREQSFFLYSMNAIAHMPAEAMKTFR